MSLFIMDFYYEYHCLNSIYIYIWIMTFDSLSTVYDFVGLTVPVTQLPVFMTMYEFIVCRICVDSLCIWLYMSVFDVQITLCISICICICTGPVYLCRIYVALTGFTVCQYSYVCLCSVCISVLSVFSHCICEYILHDSVFMSILSVCIHLYLLCMSIYTQCVCLYSVMYIYNQCTYLYLLYMCIYTYFVLMYIYIHCLYSLCICISAHCVCTHIVSMYMPILIIFNLYLINWSEGVFSWCLMQKFQMQLSAKHPTFFATTRLGRNLKDRCTKLDPERDILTGMLEDLKNKWNAVRLVVTTRYIC